MEQALNVIRGLIVGDYSDYQDELNAICKRLLKIQQDFDEKMTNDLEEMSIHQTPSVVPYNTGYRTPIKDTSFNSKTSDIPSLPHFKTPLPKNDELSFATNSSHTMPRLPLFRTPAAKHTPSSAMSSPNSIITPIKHSFNIKALPQVFQQDEAKDQVFLLHSTLLQKDKWHLNDLKEKLPFSGEKVDLLVKVFSEKGFIQLRNDFLSAK